MMVEQGTEKEPFYVLLEDLYRQSAQEDPLQKVKAKAWDHFQELGLPTRRHEVFKYVRLRNLFARSFEFSSPSTLSATEIAPHILPECQKSLIVLVNGYFIPSLSCLDALPKRASVSLLEEALRTYGGFLNSQWAKTIKEETDPFATLNTALHRQGIFLYLPPKTIVEAPLQILHIIDAKNTPMFIMPRFQAFIGSQSQLSLVHTQAVLSGQNFAINGFWDIAIEEEAHVKYTQAVTGLSNNIWQFEALRATLKRNSSLKSVAITDGASTVRNDYRVALTGENAEVSLNGVWMLSDKKEAHAHVLMDHQAPSCRSMQLFKSALNDTSRSSFEGKILVRQAAQKTEAFQLNNNLLLSDYANADSKPNLEIFADDVKASHGSTFGQLDKEQLFYMKTRGFSDAAAKNLLVYGFCKEVIDMIPVTSLQAHMRRLAQNYLAE